MKNKSILMGLIFLLAIQISVLAQNQKAKPLWTIEQVKEMAKPYHLEDTVGSQNYSFLKFISKEEVDKYLENKAAIVAKRKDMAAYLAKTQTIRNYDDYIKLLNAHPNVKKEIAKSHGGDEKYQQYLADAKKFKWRIYRNAKGGVGFWRADTEVTTNELKFGKRIDNLPQFKY